MNEMYGDGEDPIEDYHRMVKNVINEEIFHMYTHALAKVYPS